MRVAASLRSAAREWEFMSPSALRRRTLLSGTVLLTAVAGYGRRAYAACVNSGGSTYQCSGANATTQTITANNASVSTLAGFSVNTAALFSTAITITGNGALSYTDINGSPLTAATDDALYVRSGGDFAGTPGSVTINTNGVLSGGSNAFDGIRAYNRGTGAVTVTANGNVTGNLSSASGFGISAYSRLGTDVTVTTGAGTTVSGATAGIYGGNFGRGAL